MIRKLIKILSLFFFTITISLWRVTPLDAGVAAPMQSPGFTADNVNLMAFILLKEIGSHPDSDIQAVANAIMNQYYGFGGKISIGEILFKPGNFSGAVAPRTKGEKKLCRENPRYCGYMHRNWTNEQYEQAAQAEHFSKAKWEHLKDIAKRALSGQLTDITKGSYVYKTCVGGKSGFYNAANQHHTYGSGTLVHMGQYQGAHCYYKNYAVGSYLGVNFDERRIAAGNAGNLALSEATATSNSDGGAGGGSGYYEEAWDNGGFNNFELTDERYIAACTNNAVAQQNGSASASAETPISHGLDRLKTVMVRIYQSLNKLFIIGSYVVCYSTVVNPIDFIVISIPNINYWITGWIIIICAFFMTLSVAMYFLDISIKIAFAILMLPISIGLWPFKPTQYKIQQNLSVILHNAMLSAFLCVGVAYAVKLLEVGINANLDDGSFQEAIKNNSTEYMSQNFSLFSFHIIVLIFALIFGFKIIAASVNNYLNNIFGDELFGSASPMHHKATQMLGNIANKTIIPAASFGKDVAKASAGRGIAAVGRSMQRMSKGDFSDIKNIGVGIKKVVHKATHPGELVADTGNYIGKKARKINTIIGEGKKQASDFKHIFSPKKFSMDQYEADRNAIEAETQRENAAIDESLSRTFGKISSGVEEAGKTAKSFAMDLPGVETAGKASQSLKNAGITVGNAGRTVADSVKERVGDIQSEIDNYSAESAFSFSPGNIKSLFNGKTLRTLGRLAREAKDDFKMVDGKKLILKKAGNGIGHLVVRSLKDTGTQAGKAAKGTVTGTVGGIGKIFETLGNDLADNRKKEKPSWADKLAAEMENDRLEEEQYYEEEERLRRE